MREAGSTFGLQIPRRLVGVCAKTCFRKFVLISPDQFVTYIESIKRPVALIDDRIAKHDRRKEKIYKLIESSPATPTRLPKRSGASSPSFKPS
jgi:hypothetical protein